MQTDFDVIISGGGLSGLLTAIGLKNECPLLRIAIVEPVNVSSSDEIIQSNFDQRCLALSYGTLQLLNHWNVWPRLKKNGWPIKSIVTSDRGHVGKTIMQAKEYGLNAMGHVVSMHNLGVALKSTLLTVETNSHSPQIQWFCPDTIQQLSYVTETADAGQEALASTASTASTVTSVVKVKLSSGAEISGQLLIVAEGGNSTTRDLLNIQSSTQKYNQSAIVVNVKVGSSKLATSPKILERFGDPSEVAFERFTTNGPLAFLPIGKNEYNVVWTQTPEEAEQDMALSEQDFCDKLQREFGFAAGKIVKTTTPVCYPLSLTTVERLVAQNTVLLGNSAHSIHPIAGQGFNLGVRDIGVLVFAIKEQLAAINKENGPACEGIGSFSLLNEYQKNRQEDITRITEFTDSLVRIFALPGRLPALTRTAGLMSLQQCNSLQQWLALHFMGSHKQFNLP